MVDLTLHVKALLYCTAWEIDHLQGKIQNTTHVEIKDKGN